MSDSRESTVRIPLTLLFTLTATVVQVTPTASVTHLLPGQSGPVLASSMSRTSLVIQARDSPSLFRNLRLRAGGAGARYLQPGDADVGGRGGRARGGQGRIPGGSTVFAA